MERDQQHKLQDQNQSSLLSLNPKEIGFTDSPRNVNSTNDRLKRDEWSEGAVSSLLEAYESKWTLRNRAKLKGQDWEDVAKHVSARGNGSKSAKTQTQCKNKIESMKKRYRSESAAADASSWPLYPRLDLLLRGNGPAAAAASNPPPVVIELPPVTMAPPVAAEAAPPPAVLELRNVAQNSHGSNDGYYRLAKDEGDGTNNDGKVRNQEFEKNRIDEAEDHDSSTPPIHIESPNYPPKGNKYERKEKSTKRGREEYGDAGESIRWLAEVVVRSEQARMETMREIERMRAEAEIKRGEMDLKRTEIIANTQLQIAKLFAKGSVEDWKKPT